LYALDHSILFQFSERLPERIPRDAQYLREFRLGRQRLPGDQPPGSELLVKMVANALILGALLVRGGRT
jgi:hypothetical protein